MKFVPNGKRYLVHVIEEEQKTSGGFIVTSRDRGDLVSAIIARTGYGFEVSMENDLLGKTVYFKEGDGVKITLEGQNYLIVDDEKVLGFL